MWWLSLSSYIVPSSAAVAGLFTWLMTRNDRPADGDLLRPDDLPAPTLAFSTTGDPDEFRGLARRFLGPEVETVFGNLGSAPVAVAP